MSSSLISLLVRRLDEDKDLQELRIRNVSLNSLDLSTCYTVFQSSGIHKKVSHLVRCMQNAE